MRARSDSSGRMVTAAGRLPALAPMLAVALAASWGACAQAPAQAPAQTPAPGTPAAAVPGAIVGAFDKLFGGPYPGKRAVHAKGLVLEGSFTAAPGAAALSRAPHLRGGTVPVLARFSDFAAVPGLPNGDPLASPRGLAIKFVLPDGSDTDIVAHSYDGFPASTPAEFLDFLRALPDPTRLDAFAASHLAARRFLDDPKPAPASYGTETYFGVNAFRFSNASGGSSYGRYRIVPVAGNLHLDARDAAGRAPDYLATELAERLRRGAVEFRLLVQVAAGGDAVEDGSVSWPADRPAVELGTISLRALLAPDDGRRVDLTFVPTNLLGGIEPSGDPMLLARTQAYRISAERRAEERGAEERRTDVR